MFENVLVAMKDGTDHGPLLDLARKVAPAPARLHLVSLIRVGAQQDEPQRLESRQKKLDDVAEGLRGEGYDVRTHVGLVVAAAGLELAHKASDMGCDLIVMGLAKRTRVGKALMGSDAQRVLLSAGCPVIVNRLY